ncbi:MAG: hypothetical protein K6C08_12040 [Oscillospiraceae bacterium]|nr:hypothetical protein [Oscillospiraceae bacterium]
MKKTIATVSAIALALGITMMSGGVAMAETPEVSPTPVIESEIEENDYFSWIGDGMRWVRETYTTSRDAVIDGTEWLIESTREWNETVQEYLDERKSDPEVREAWNTLRDGAEHAGKVSEEAAAEAYHTVRDWMLKKGDAIDQHVASALDRMASAAGVREAEIAEWYRTVENFVTSNAEEMSEDTMEAWQVVKEANIEGTKLVKEEIMEAYEDVRDWVVDFGTESADAAEDALKRIMEELEDRD